MKKTPNRLKLLSASAAISAIGMLALGSTSASASGTYYTCDTPTSCKKVDKRILTTSYNATKYPIVMAHGFLGWNRMLGIVDYFNGIPQTLISNGADVFTTKTTTVNSSEVRGEELLKQVRMIKAITGSKKVNLVGHSQGGLDSRYVAGVDPQAIASITTVASPHTGAGLADILSESTRENGTGDFNLNGKILSTVVEIIGGGISTAAGTPLTQAEKQNAMNALDSISEKAFIQFNKDYPAPIPSSYCGQPPANNVMNGVAYYSFSGVGQITNVLDPSDYLLQLTGSLYDKDDLNDGVVTKCSSRVGKVIRDDYKMNHLDSINQFLGLVSWAETNPLPVYRQQINRLKNDGY
jgi:triacylglycerol lipase